MSFRSTEQTSAVTSWHTGWAHSQANADTALHLSDRDTSALFHSAERYRNPRLAAPRDDTLREERGGGGGTAKSRSQRQTRPHLFFLPGHQSVSPSACHLLGLLCGFGGLLRRPPEHITPQKIAEIRTLLLFPCISFPPSAMVAAAASQKAPRATPAQTLPPTSGPRPPPPPPLAVPEFSSDAVAEAKKKKLGR